MAMPSRDPHTEVPRGGGAAKLTWEPRVCGPGQTSGEGGVLLQRGVQQSPEWGREVTGYSERGGDGEKWQG